MHQADIYSNDSDLEKILIAILYIRDTISDTVDGDFYEYILEIIILSLCTPAKKSKSI